MNLIADAMEPLLDLAGIRYGRNDPEGDVRRSVALSNAGCYDLHVAIHSNAAAPGYEGLFQGPIVFYYPGDEKGKQASELIRDGLRRIYPQPCLPKVMENDSLYELRETRAPTAFVEIAYHDNLEDAEWIINHIDLIADSLVESIACYFCMRYAESGRFAQGIVNLQNGMLHVRRAPDVNAPVLGTLQNGDVVTVLRCLPGWFLIQKEDWKGYASNAYIECREEGFRKLD